MLSICREFRQDLVYQRMGVLTPVLSSQQKNPGQDQNLQRPLGQPQLSISDT
ncbi:hypothetical protein M9458_029587, partial [Cirrhinus mrigala]